MDNIYYWEISVFSKEMWHLVWKGRESLFFFFSKKKKRTYYKVVKLWAFVIMMIVTHRLLAFMNIWVREMTPVIFVCHFREPKTNIFLVQHVVTPILWPTYLDHSTVNFKMPECCKQAGFAYLQNKQSKCSGTFWCIVEICSHSAKRIIS